MKPIKRTKEFRSDAIKMVTEQGLSMAVAARQLGVHYDTFRYWMDQAKAAAPGALAAAKVPQDALVRELQKENAILRMEREILKKATAFFVKEQR